MGNPRTQLEARLSHDRDEMIRLCQDLVRIPTETPPGDTREAFRCVGTYLERKGLAYETPTYEPTMPNLVASFAGAGPGPHLVLNAHLDVFPAGDPSRWSGDPFSGALRDDKLFGRGITDMKAGAVASIFTYAYLSEFRRGLRGRLTLTLVSDEERFGPFGARALL